MPLTETVDAVVIGTGAGGSPLLARLAQAGLKVVALEAGPFWDPARDFATDERAQTKLFWNDERLSAGGNPLAFGANNSGIGVGGSTLHYTAYTPRAHPDDFRLHTDFGVGVDWPLGYADLEPYYDELEQFLGVSGPSPYPWDAHRTAVPACAAAAERRGPAHAAGLRRHGHSDLARAERRPVRAVLPAGRRLAAGLHQSGLLPGRVQRRREGQHGRDVYSRRRCRPGRKSARSASSRRSRPTRRAASSGVVYTQDGREQRQPCRNVFLCAGAIETPRLLLLNGLANSSGQVGRNFMAHTGNAGLGAVRGRHAALQGHSRRPDLGRHAPAQRRRLRGRLSAAKPSASCP